MAASTGCYLRVQDLAAPDDRYQLGPCIAEGTYGEIFAATETGTGKQVAIKIIDNTEETFPDIEEEYRILKDLSVHKNIPKLHGVFRKASSSGTDQIWIAMEYCSGGPVTELVKRLKDKGQTMKEDHIAYILYNAVQAACHLHRNHVMHRDIKGQNILLTETGDIKLVDFGISRHLASTMARQGTSIGTPYWMAPEVILCDQLRDAHYDIRADVWSLGITAIELGDGVPPLASVHPVRAMFQITRNPPPSLARPADWSQPYLDFIVECLEKNQENRPLMEEVASHPFLTRIESRLEAIRAELAQLLVDAGPADATQPAQVTSKAGYLRSRAHSKSLEILQDDLAALEEVTEDKILNLLEKRFHRGLIYTFVADVLIAVNPYCVKPLYDAKEHEAYCGRARSDRAPHVFAVADRAHQDMAHHQRPQAIVFTGEAASGKTFNARMTLKHLCHLGKSAPLAEKVMGAGFILELLSSAVTSSNTASTRQLRYIETTFTKTGRLSGAILWQYMLERWRITDTRPNDGTFNALYAYYYGLQQSQRLGIYKLANKNEYRFLPKHAHLDPVDSAEKFKEFERTLDLLEISSDKQETVRKTMAAIILLGEVQFEDGEDGVVIANRDVLSTVSFLLSVDETKLVWSLAHRCRIVSGEAVKEVKTPAEAAASRDALARLLYGRLVDSIVNWVNAAFTLTRLLFGETNTVGLLDMYGFESRSTNYIEQLVVNAFNEQVQSFYNQSVFQWEMDDMGGDGLEVPPYEYVDNSSTIDMLMKKGEGLLALLDESSLSEHASDRYFIENCKELTENRHFLLEKEGFAIAHYAGKVSYSNKAIVAKNKDHLDPEVFDTLRQSENPFVAPMFLLPLTKTGNLTMDREQAQKEAGGKGRRVPLYEQGGNKRFDTRSRGRLSQTSLVLLTQASCYRFSAMEVMHKLINSTPHFVRCVRSNGDAAADTWDTGLVAHQLRYMQVVNTVAIRKNGYSQRIDFAEFLRRYQFLAFDFDETVDVTRDNCRLLMVRLKLDGYLMGREKIFLKYFNEEYMSRLYEHEVKKIAKVQAMIRAFLVRRRRRAGQPLDVTRLLASDGRKFRRRSSGGATGARYRRRSSAAAHRGKLDENDETRALAAETIQLYFRRWRGRSLFQQLQRYRSARHHDLVVFSHQVHIYGQECFHYVNRNRTPVEAASIAAVDRDVARGTAATRLKMIAAVRKLPLSRSLADFVDTADMCTPHQPSPQLPTQHPRATSPVPSSTSDGGRRTPELGPSPRPVSPAGLQSAPSPAGLQRAPTPVDRSGANSPAPLDDRSGANSPAQLDEELEEIAAGYGATVSESRAVFEERRPVSPRPTSAGGRRVPHPAGAPPPPTYAAPAPAPSYAPPAPAYTAPAPAPRYAPPQPPAPASRAVPRPTSAAAATPAAAAASGGAGNSMWGKRWATTPAAPAPVVRELQDRGITSDEPDAPPFNFQGMLRKTNVTRNSLKRASSDRPATALASNVTIASYSSAQQPSHGAPRPAGYQAGAPRTPRSPDQLGLPASGGGGDGRQLNGQAHANGDPGNGTNDHRTPTPHIVFEGEEVDL